jgi:hypothetical protein
LNVKRLRLAVIAIARLTFADIAADSWELSWCDHHSPFVIFLRARSNERSHVASWHKRRLAQCRSSADNQ